MGLGRPGCKRMASRRAASPSGVSPAGTERDAETAWPSAWSRATFPVTGENGNRVGQSILGVLNLA